MVPNMTKIPRNEHLRWKQSKSVKQYKKKKSAYCWGFYLDVLVRHKYSHAVMEPGTLSYISKPTLALKTQIKKLNELKNHLNNMDAKSLLLSVDNLIHLATRYYHGTKDLPFDWSQRTFLPIDKRGWKISYPDTNVSIDHLIMLREPDAIYVESDDEEECDTVKVDPKCTPSHSEAHGVRAYYLLCLESVSGTLHDIFTEKHSRLRSISQYVLTRDERNTAMSEIC